MAVADGMGGMAAGEVASRLALTVLVDLVLETPDWMLESGRAPSGEGDRAGDPALRSGQSDGPRGGPSPALAQRHGHDADHGVQPGREHADRSCRRLAGLHACAQGGLHRLTRDHTVAQQMAEHGPFPSHGLSPRYRHVLTQAIGVRDNGRRTRHPAIVARGRRPTAALQRRTDRHGGRSDDRHAPEERREQREGVPGPPRRGPRARGPG